VSSARKRLRAFGAAIGRALRDLARLPRAIAAAVGAFWARLSVHARRRLVAALGAVVLLVLFFTLAVPNLPCQLPGGDECAPADDAAELVPADALAYLHANLDPEVDQYERATEVAGRLPIISGELATRAIAGFPGPGGAALNFERDIRPWFGGEAAIAIVSVAERPERVALLEVEQAAGATSFAEEIAAGNPDPEDYQGVELSIDGRGLATAQVEGFLAIGAAAGVRAVIDSATGVEGAAALADDESATEVRDDLPEHRFAEAYVSEDGAAELLDRPRGLAGSIAPLVGVSATEGAAAALSATDDGDLELAVRSKLDPERAKASPGFFSAFPRFEPALPERLDAGTLGYLGIGQPRTTVRALLAQASAQAPGIAAGFEDLANSLRREGEVDIERELLDAFGGEAAFLVAPRPTDAASPPGAEAPLAGSLPYVEFVADEVDEERARRALASLQGPLTAELEGSDVQAPVFDEQDIGGVQARSVRISPAVELTYAIFDGLAVVASDPAGVAELVEGEGGLDGADRYERATEDFEDEVSLIAYLDLGGLIAIGEQLGLAEDPVYATFAGEFRRLEALGIAVTGTDELLSTDARLLLSSESAGEGEPEPLAPPAD
jgi:hypothetical protein